MRPFIAIITGSSLVPVTGLKIGKQPSDWHQNQAEMPGLISRIHAVFFRVPGISSTESATLTYFIDRD